MKDSKEYIEKAHEMEKVTMNRAAGYSGMVCEFSGHDVYMSHPRLGYAHISVGEWNKIINSLYR